jgi:biopolymer transport protein ExbD
LIHARPSRRSWSRISFALMPLIDVVLLLVLFFALAQGVTRAPLEPLALPRSASGAPGQEELSAPIVTVRADGSLLLDGRPVPIDALRAALAERRGGTPRIRADRELAYGRVREVLEAIGGAGRTVALGVEPRHDAGGARP